MNYLDSHRKIYEQVMEKNNKTALKLGSYKSWTLRHSIIHYRWKGFPSLIMIFPLQG